jgi:hypothetical protein
MNVIIILLLFLFIVGIIGVNYFKGNFSMCVLPTLSNEKLLNINGGD